MNIITGSNFPNSLQGTSGDDTIHGRGGNDLITGWGGNDTLYGDDGNDQISGDTGNDRLFGGNGNDRLSGEGGTDYANGGFGRDVLFGGGTMIGGHGNDTVLLTFGEAFGDNPNVASAAGTDSLYTDLGQAAGQDRGMTGGRGADEFEAILDAHDGIVTRLEVRDFNRVEGDRLFLGQRVTDNDHLTAAETFAELDRNGDRVLSVADGGHVFADPEGLALQGLDGDVMVLAGCSSVAAADFILG